MHNELTYFLEKFDNSEAYNDNIFEQFTTRTNETEFLKTHRDYIEADNLGFGDRAFHYMWYLLIKHLMEKKADLSFLEIGVFKGQIVSLWALIASELNIVNYNITGITPLEGKTRPKFTLVKKLYNLVSSKYREDVSNGNFYDAVDYLSIIKALYNRFSLDFSKTTLIKGYSTDPAIIEKAGEKKYTLIYIDGDHSYNGAMHDIRHYTPLLASEGFLIMDDASCLIPGTKFWKGHQAVSEACESLAEMGFQNILNVGHNRIFKRG